MEGPGFVETLGNIGPLGAILATLSTILAGVIRSIINGGLVPRRSHEDIINIYRERANEAYAREQWWRDQAYAENHIAGRSVDLAADLATRRAIINSARNADRGTEDD